MDRHVNDCGRYAGYCEHTAADNVSSPKPTSPGDYSDTGSGLEITRVGACSQTALHHLL
jgi:hypothetical protein